MTGEKLIVAYDGSLGSKKALMLAANLAQGLSAQLILLRVLDPAKLIDSELNDVEKSRVVYNERYKDSLAAGKELVAHSIHNLSNRRKNPFVRINASALPEALAESELFGYEEGSFTGAIKEGKKGKFGFNRSPRVRL